MYYTEEQFEQDCNRLRQACEGDPSWGGLEATILNRLITAYRSLQEKVEIASPVMDILISEWSWDEEDDDARLLKAFKEWAALNTTVFECDEVGCETCEYYLTPWKCNGGTEENPCPNLVEDGEEYIAHIPMVKITVDFENEVLEFLENLSKDSGLSIDKIIEGALISQLIREHLQNTSRRGINGKDQSWCQGKSKKVR